MTEVAKTTVVRTRAELREALAAAPRPVGLVPTMGWLHEGHRALMRRARAENATVVVSIFVNPRQFNVASDFTRYPRNEARDLAMCEAEGVDLVFAPEVEEIYPPGFATTVSVGAVALPLEGAARPGPFRWRRDRRGDPVRPGRGGTRVLRPEGRAAGHGHPPDGPRPRDRDGGRDLSHDPRAGRPRAVVTERAPDPGGARGGAGPAPGAAWRRAMRGGRASGTASGCATTMFEILTQEPLVDVEYVSIADALTLEELTTVDRPALASLAVRFGTTRLIDNEILDATTGTAAD